MLKDPQSSLRGPSEDSQKTLRRLSETLRRLSEGPQKTFRRPLKYALTIPHKTRYFKRTLQKIKFWSLKKKTLFIHTIYALNEIIVVIELFYSES